MLNVREIPPNIGYYLAGFTDGEGSFNVSFRPRDDPCGYRWTEPCGPPTSIGE